MALKTLKNGFLMHLIVARMLLNSIKSIAIVTKSIVIFVKSILICTKCAVICTKCAKTSVNFISNYSAPLSMRGSAR